MAYHENAKAVTLIAGEDLRGDIAEALKIDAQGRVIKTTAATDVIIGTLAADTPGDSTGKGVPVAVIGGGVFKMKAGAAITAGQLVVPSATAGRVAGAADIAALTANQMAVGVALEAASEGDIFSVLVQSIAGPTG